MKMVTVSAKPAIFNQKPMILVTVSAKPAIFVFQTDLITIVYLLLFPGESGNCLPGVSREIAAGLWGIVINKQ